MAVSAAALDFTDVKDAGPRFSKTRQPAGDYKGRVTMVQDTKSNKDQQLMWLYTIEVNGHTYPLYCKLVPEQLWKLRSLYSAAGIVIPKKRIKIDPNRIVGKYIGVTLEDTEYDGKAQSQVAATIPLSQIQANADDDLDDVEDDEDEDLVNTDPPVRRKPKVEPEPEDEDEDEEEAEEEAPPPQARKAKKATTKRPAPSRTVDDGELEELDLDDL